MCSTASFIRSVSVASPHACDLQHRLVVFFHEVFLVGVLPVDVWHRVAQVILPRIEMGGVRVGGDRDCGLPVAVGREDLREGVSHSQLAIESVAEEGLSRVKTSICESMLGSWRERIVAIVVWQFGLEELSLRGQQPLHHLGGFGHVASARAGLALGHGSGVRWPFASTTGGRL